MELGPAAPTSPIPFAGTRPVNLRPGHSSVPMPDDVVDRLRGVCPEVSTELTDRIEASRDWWPLAMVWARDDEVPAVAAAVCRPTDAVQVAQVLAICNEARIPLTAAGGRSGVLGGSIPLYGGVLLDLCGLSGIIDVDHTSMILDVAAGTFGDHLEDELRRDHNVTVGHWPQSMSLATVGGWLACRGAGQLSTRYGKIEDIVVGLDVALADGRRIRTGGVPRQAVGPDLNQVFVGSEGTLGVITSARLRLHPAPTAEVRSAWSFPDFHHALDAMRHTLQRGATPAVMRLYDGVESKRNYGTDGTRCVLLALDEGDDAIVTTMIGILNQEAARAGAEPLDEALVETWLAHRNDVSALQELVSGGIVVDTMEISARWAALPHLYDATIEAIGGVAGTLAVSAHQSHSYPDGGCLYFTFAGKVPLDERTAYHRAVWDAGVAAVLAGGGSLSHHHGIGLHRSRYVADALGGAFDVVASLKAALDPNGILNPGKLGLASPFEQ